MSSHGYTDGELLPCYGGPLDGQQRRVSVIFPFLNGGVANSGFQKPRGHYYVRDDENRRWKYAGTDGTQLKGMIGCRGN